MNTDSSLVAMNTNIDHREGVLIRQTNALFIVSSLISENSNSSQNCQTMKLCSSIKIENMWDCLARETKESDNISMKFISPLNSKYDVMYDDKDLLVRLYPFICLYIRLFV